MGDQYVCIGPYVEMKARAEVEEEDFPPHHPLGIFYVHTTYRNYETQILKTTNFELKIEIQKIFIGQAVTRSRQKGYKVVCGRWLVEGNPQVILFDVGSAAFRMAEFKHELYEKAGIGIPNDDIETNDVCLFGQVYTSLYISTNIAYHKKPFIQSNITH